MDVRSKTLKELVRSPGGQKLIRYSMVSVVSIVIGQGMLFFTFSLFHLWSAAICNVIACIAGGIPSYYLNRRWAWGKTGKSHMWKEVAPFWALAFLGLVFSTWAVAWAEGWARSFSNSHLVVSLSVQLAAISAFGVLWIAKFVLFNKLMFVHNIEDLPEALDGRTGIPT